MQKICAKARRGWISAADFLGGGEDIDLSPGKNVDEAAANLFTYLRALDQGGAENIAVAPIPEVDLGEAINDRLRRAAAPRG